MSKLSTPRLMIGGTGAGVGKSLITLGIAQELRRDNTSVSCLLTAPHLSQALILRRALGRYVGILDSHILSAPQIATGVLRASLGADVVLIDGSKGIFDGVGPQLQRGSDAEIAALLKIPTVLVADVSHCGATIGPLMRGFEQPGYGFDIVGYLFNRAAGERGVSDEEFYRDVAKKYGLKPVYGVVPELSLDGEIPSNWLSQRDNVVSLGRQFSVDLSAAVRKSISMDGLLVCAGDADVVDLPEIEINPAPRRCRIAVADDPCFGISFQDNFDLLRLYGAEVVPFSPLADARLPARIGAVYLGGAMLRDYGRDLAANDGMREALCGFVEQGGVVYAEGGGAVYLCQSFQISKDEGPCQGVGIIPAVAVEAKSGWSYCETVTIEDSVLGRAGSILRGVYPEDWRIQREDKIVKVSRISRARAAGFPEGYSPSAQVYATLALNHFGANPDIARSIVESAEVNYKITKS
ncbi:MAG: hypothetical protein QY326_09450 [Bdellovibrionota bacterium]|nr:MAG: hypothetical protein QY326_09450 [Bdellovibrionota bacterium]